MKLSIVATLYQSELYLAEFYRRSVAAAEAICSDFEIILVNDGSPDDCLARSIEIQKKDPRVCVIDLSRNFGHHKAMMTGLEAASGSLVFLIDSDLEEPPELLLEFIEKMRQTGCDVIFGVQAKRRGSAFERMSGETFYRLFNKISNVKIPPNMVTARLMTRRYVQSLLLHRERELFLDGLWAATGYDQLAVPISKSHKGQSSYSTLERFSLALTSITSFSSRPLIAAMLLGGAISFISFLVIVYLIVQNLSGEVVAGWTSTLASIWLLGGLTIFFVGAVGVYVAKIFIEVKQRPYTIVREKYASTTDVNGEQVVTIGPDKIATDRNSSNLDRHA
jgi:putative glycosyltransferase